MLRKTIDGNPLKSLTSKAATTLKEGSNSFLEQLFLDSFHARERTKLDFEIEFPRDRPARRTQPTKTRHIRLAINLLVPASVSLESATHSSFDTDTLGRVDACVAWSRSTDWNGWNGPPRVREREREIRCYEEEGREVSRPRWEGKKKEATKGVGKMDR